MRELFKLTIVLTIICAAAATALAFAYTITKEPIAYQQRLKKLKAIRAVQPEYDNEPDQDFVDLSLSKNEKGEDDLTRFYITKRGGVITGVVFLVSATGYSGTINIMLGVTPEGTITGVQVLGHSETPGLGAKITEDDFCEQFKSKNLANSTWALKKDGGDIDQVTGATISPRATLKAIHDGLVTFAERKDELLNTGS